MKILVTGGTVFVSRYVAEYFAARGDDVFVLNRNTKEQPAGVTLLEGDRHALGDCLKGMHFDAVLDVTAYTGKDIADLLDALDSYDAYVMISSSAVYPENGEQPFAEDSVLAENCFWGQYGTDKIEAEQTLLSRVPDAYILRPPYLYGPMNNVYREAFVFDCALSGRKFYLPGEGEMKLQFYYVGDLCRFMERILAEKPECHIFNVGNQCAISIREWVERCYAAAGKTPEFVSVLKEIEQRNYFSFYNYEYYLDVTRQSEIMPEETPMEEGLLEALRWYEKNADQVRKKPYIQYIEEHLSERE